MFCRKCGTQLDDGAMFCHKCGTQVLDETVQKPLEESIVNNSAIQQSVKRIFDSSEGNRTTNIREDMSVKKKCQKSTILIGMAALILVIVAAIVAIGRRADDEGSAESSDFVEEINDNDSTLQDEESLTEVFTDNETGISFHYPEGWVILDSSGEFKIVEMIDSENTPDHIATINVDIILDQDPYGVYTQDEASVQETVNEYGKFLEMKDTQLGDIPAKVLKYQKEGLNSDDIVTFFWYKIGEEIYQVTYSCTASTIDAYEPIFEAVMKSYTVNPAISEQSKTEIFGFEADYREVYADKVRELSTNDNSIQFAIIDLFDNGVPELVADRSGYDVSVFTWVDEEIITLMNQCPYGAMGNMGYEYLPGQNVIRNYNMDNAGAIVYESYMKVNDSYEVVGIYNEDISVRYVRDTNANGMIDEEDEYSDEPAYYCNETEISEEEYHSYQIDGDYKLITGDMSAEAMLDLLQESDEVIADTLSSSDSIEDYSRLGGVYSDSIGYTTLSLSIYTSQEEGELAIGTAFFDTGEDEVYLGEIIPVEERVYGIDTETGDKIILEESEGEGILLQMYENGEYIDSYKMIEHYES